MKLCPKHRYPLVEGYCALCRAVVAAAALAVSTYAGAAACTADWTITSSDYYDQGLGDTHTLNEPSGACAALSTAVAPNRVFDACTPTGQTLAVTWRFSNAPANDPAWQHHWGVTRQPAGCTADPEQQPAAAGDVLTNSQALNFLAYGLLVLLLPAGFVAGRLR